MSPVFEVIHGRLCDRDLADGALETARDFVPADAAKQDDMTGEVIASTSLVNRWNTSRVGFSARRCP